MKNKIFKTSLLIMTLLGLSVFAFAEQEKVIKIFRNGSVVAEYNASEIDYIQVDDLKKEDDSKVDYEAITVNGVSFKMIKVEGGTYMMGSNNGDSNEKPVHSETVGTFHIGETEVTQALWTAVMGTNPSHFIGDNLPVEKVSWDDCQRFIIKLNELTGKKFRMPTEVEWEYAARGGNQSKNYTWSGSNIIDDVAWYYANSGRETHPVAQKLPNELGIYDMSGNVNELCQDRYSESYSDPRNSTNHVYRGGSWYHTTQYHRVTARGCASMGYRFYALGLRLAL